MSSRTTEEKRQKGIYYTPNEATKILCNWAIREAEARLLEPSFGACGFLEASSKRLSELGNADPCLQLYGCDVDERAFDAHLWPIFNERNELLSQFHIEDFLAMKPGAWNTNFDVVIGNPPYVSHHRMSETQKANLRTAFENSPWPLDRRADLWAYFVLHSLHFLRVGGRVAWILPGSFLHSDYAAQVRAVIGDNFGKSLGIQLGQKLFVTEGAQENTIVLLADGYGQPGEGLRVQFAETLEDLTHTIAGWDSGEATGQLCGERVQEAFLLPEVRETIGEIERDFEVKSLGDYCVIRIGIVTGCNPFFVFNQIKADSHHLPSKFLRPILPKFDMVSGLEFTTADLESSVASDVSCLLLDTQNWQERPDDAVGLYLASFDETDKAKNKTFQKRGLWHQPDDRMTPCAFLSYMHEHGPRLALNEARTTSTNTIHRVFFHSHFGLTDQKAVAIALQSTFGQLCAEIEGRAYGSGVLKHEPNGARRIRLVLPSRIDEAETCAAFDAIDRLFRDNKQVEARQVADRFAMKDLISRRGEDAFARTCQVLDQALLSMRARRRHKVASPSIKGEPVHA